MKIVLRRKWEKKILDTTIIIALKSQQYINSVSVVLKFYEGGKQIGKENLKSLLSGSILEQEQQKRLRIPNLRKCSNLKQILSLTPSPLDSTYKILDFGFLPRVHLI